MSKFLVWGVFFFVLNAGCAGWSNAPRVATTCSPEQAWSIALASLQEFELRRINKTDGVIETDWTALQTNGKSGLFQRTLNEERARFIVTIQPETGKSLITVQQIREFWSPQGVQSRSWRQVPPNQEQERQMATRIKNRLKMKSC